EIPHKYAAPLLPAAVGVDGGRECHRQPTAVLALHREDTLKATRRTTLCQRLQDLRVREVNDRAATERSKLGEQVSEEHACSRIGIEDRPVLRARKKYRIEPVLYKLGVYRFIWCGHNSPLHPSQILGRLSPLCPILPAHEQSHGFVLLSPNVQSVSERSWHRSPHVRPHPLAAR